MRKRVFDFSFLYPHTKVHMSHMRRATFDTPLPFAKMFRTIAQPPQRRLYRSLACSKNGRKPLSAPGSACLSCASCECRKGAPCRLQSDVTACITGPNRFTSKMRCVTPLSLPVPNTWAWRVSRALCGAARTIDVEKVIGGVESVCHLITLSGNLEQGGERFQTAAL